MSILGYIALWFVVSIALAPFFGAFAGFNQLDKDE